MDNRGLEKLDQWLLKYGNDDSILSASELDGYFAAIVSGPRQVAPAVLGGTFEGGEVDERLEDRARLPARGDDAVVL